jgi:sugar lactone lactonase YvrE
VRLTAALIALFLAQTPPVATPIWSVTDGIDTPESVYYDSASGFLFSSQIVGNVSAHDGNGRIVRLSLDGKVVDATWAKGLDAPKGLRAHDGTLFVADIDTIVGFDIRTARETSRVRIADAKFLNDLAVGPDGAIYTTDSFANRVWAVRGGGASLFSDAPQLQLPNGILVDGSRVIVATDGMPAGLFAIDVNTKTVTQIAAGTFGTPDGIEPDGRGGFLVSDVARGGVYDVSATGESR